MKRTALSLLLALSSLILAAQGGIPVNYQGDKPTISDFTWALLSFTGDEDEEDCTDEAMNSLKEAWIRHAQGIPQEEGVTITVDEKNGFVLYESGYDDYLSRIELCYWNESDKKHKLIAVSVSGFFGGKYSPGQFDGLRFYRYDNAARKMTGWDDTGFEVEYSADGAWINYDLPRTGRDITVNYWYESGKKQKVLKWNGRRFALSD